MSNDKGKQNKNQETEESKKQEIEKPKKENSDQNSEDISIEKNVPGVGLVKARRIEDEMQDSYLDYAMSVIVARALPDVRDGLKPVHRRILYAMHELGLRSNVKYRKSATVVGEVLGKYHPHGDVAVYDSLVRMAQFFSLRYTLVDGQGNFGSMDGDSPAAMRYTECRMTKIAEEMLTDIEKKTVQFVPNYDGTRNEPQVLPSKLPQLLLNGALGIAVGMATNIPPHNLSELVAGITHLIDNPESTTEDLMEFITGPDFPTGGIVYGKESIKSAYGTGRGKIIIRGVANIAEKKKGGFRIIISEIPYQVNKAVLITRIAELVKLKKVEGISDIRDESDRKYGVRIVIELKQNAYAKKILNKLYELTDLQTAFHFNTLALVDGLQPRLLTLKNILEEFIKHRQVVVKRRTEFDLAQAKARAHILEGLKKALDHIDEVITTIRSSETKEIAHKNLISKFELTDLQAQAILEMKLSTLAGLERKKIDNELKEKLKLIKELESILNSESRIKQIIKDELKELDEKYGDVRKTKIMASELGEFKVEDLIPNERVIVSLTTGNYIKRVPISTYRSQLRGGKGKTGLTTKEADSIDHLLVAWTHDVVMLFTDHGRVFTSHVFELPAASRQAKGQAIVNILQLMPQEKVTAILPIHQNEQIKKYFFMVTEKGVIKRTEISKYQNIRKTGIIAMKLREDDRLKWVVATNGENEIIMVTNNAQSIHFRETDARPMGRSAGGVRGIRLREGDKVIAADVIESPTAQVLTILENGNGKRTLIDKFTLQKRGGIGIRASKINAKTGKLAGAEIIYDHDGEVVIMSLKGQVIRTPIKAVKRLTRDTRGVRVMRLNSGDKVASMTILKKAKEIVSLTQEEKSVKQEETKKSQDNDRQEANNHQEVNTEQKLNINADKEKKKKSLFQPQMKKIISPDETTDFQPVIKAKKIMQLTKSKPSKIEVKRYRKLPDPGKTKDIDQSKYINKNKSEPNYWGIEK